MSSPRINTCIFIRKWTETLRGKPVPFSKVILYCTPIFLLETFLRPWKPVRSEKGNICFLRSKKGFSYFALVKKSKFEDGASWKNPDYEGKKRLYINVKTFLLKEAFSKMLGLFIKKINVLFLQTRTVSFTSTDLGEVFRFPPFLVVCICPYGQKLPGTVFLLHSFFIRAFL